MTGNKHIKSTCLAILLLTGLFAFMECYGKNESGKYMYAEFLPSSLFHDIESRILQDTDTLEIESKWFYEDDMRKSRLNVRRLFWDIDILVPDGNGNYTVADRDVRISDYDSLIINIIPIQRDLSRRRVSPQAEVCNLHIPGKVLLFTGYYTLGDQIDSLTIREGSKLAPPVKEMNLPYWTFEIRNGKIVRTEIKTIDRKQTRNDARIRRIK